METDEGTRAYLSCAGISGEEHILALFDKLQHFPLQSGFKTLATIGKGFQCSALPLHMTLGMAHLLRSKFWAASFISILQGGRCLRAPFNCCPFLAKRV